MESYEISTTTKTSFSGKPNSELSEEERDAKRIFKEKVKLQSRLKSLETTIRHAIFRKDEATELKARRKLDDLLIKESIMVKELNYVSEFSSNQNPSQENLVSIRQNSFSNEEVRKRARPYVVAITNALLHSEAAELELNGGTRNGNSTRDLQIQRAFELLQHMSKGSQTLEMFEDSFALWGYARIRFSERSLLLCSSLGRLEIPQLGQENLPAAFDPLIESQRCTRQKMWNIFINKGVRKACSIGSGPGNDIAGVISFLQMILLKNFEFLLDKIILMDWSNHWQKITVPLCEVLIERNLVKTGINACCDITKDLNTIENEAAYHELFPKNVADVDFYSISYLLSETSCKWTSFLDTLVTKSKPHTIFYFAEPTPWQLHEVQRLFCNHLDFVWLDSSMDTPSFWGTGRRAGPAVMVGLKR